MERNLLEKALEYAARGWKVFPLHTMKGSSCTCGNLSCSSAAKHPHIKEWQNHCSCDSEAIRDWWRKWPDANIGLATGSASGFFVLDIDPRHGGKESFQKLVKKSGALPKTLVSTTGGGGYHLFFNEPDVKIGNRVNILPGLDVRGEGGYVVAPPSIHKSGHQYSWLKELEQTSISDAPEWFLKFFTGCHRKVFDFGNRATVLEGGRNNFLTQEAGKLRRHGLEQSQLEEKIREINNARCTPPLPESEIAAICASVCRYPSFAGSESVASQNWSTEPAPLQLNTPVAPTLGEDLLPECLKPWVMDIAERMQVSPEFVMAPALVSFSSLVGRKIAIHPKQHDDWLVVPNTWGGVVAPSGYGKSPAMSEALKPMEQLCEAARIETEANQHSINAKKMFSGMQFESLKENMKKAIKENDHEQMQRLQEEAAALEKENDAINLLTRRYKTNDATVEKIARLLNENPNGLLLLRDELNGWLQTLGKSGREGDREFFLESWNGYGSYTVDRVGSGTLNVPALCLSIFGGIQPGKLQAYVEKTLQGSAEDDGLLQRFQILVYPELSPTWKNIDRSPDLEARKNVHDLFAFVDNANRGIDARTLKVRFSEQAQEAFDAWRAPIEERLRSNKIGCSAFESHISKYRSLAPSLALLFWILEDPNHMQADKEVSLSATILALRWCDFLEKHALKVYRIGESAEVLAVRNLADYIQRGLIPHEATVRSIYRNQWMHLKTPSLVEHALEALAELNWLRVVQVNVLGGKSKRVMIHPKFRKL